METDLSLEEVVLASPRFQELLKTVTLAAIRSDFIGQLEPVGPQEQIDWPFALMAASALTGSRSRAGLETSLRVAQSCLTLSDQSAHREAAAVLLERLGNHKALGLAEKRKLIPENLSKNWSAQIRMDVFRRQQEMTLTTANGADLKLSEFQLEFWNAASESRWLSVSAPTSAGKSFILKQWIEELAWERTKFTAIYVVPTKALIEEVSGDLRERFGFEYQIHVMPWGIPEEADGREIFVLTQERLHLLLRTRTTIKPDLLVIDEAQKFDDDRRGILLQQVLDEVVSESPTTQVIFASPLTSNPSILLEGAPPGERAQALTNDMVTVNQNLLHATQIENRSWRVDVASGENQWHLFDISLVGNPKNVARSRVAEVAFAMAGASTGNLVYANGPADAEAIATRIFNLLGEGADLVGDPDIAALIEMTASAVHPQMLLTELLNRGVAYHYGNMPQILRLEIERLFKRGKIGYLVCTSTLIEGVNLPCRNIFARKPERGSNIPMTLGDFWNLAGRAGRWGKEFQGNIICIDTDDSSAWPEVPRERVKQSISRASDRIFAEPEGLVDYIRMSAGEQRGHENPLMGAVYGMVASRVARSQSATGIVGVDLEKHEAETISAAVLESLESLELPRQLLARHSGIGPKMMEELYSFFVQQESLDKFAIPAPSAPGAREKYFQAMSLCSKYLDISWGNETHLKGLSNLLVQWMSGTPISYMISTRVKYHEARTSQKIQGVIRSVLKKIEKVARYEGPKYLACYQDVLHYSMESRGLEVDRSSVPDVELMLELGVARRTDISLMSLGLSRTSALAIGSQIEDSELDVPQVRFWIEHELDATDLPVLVLDEVRKISVRTREG